MKISKLQLILGGISIILVAALIVTGVQISFRANDIIKRKKVINYKELVYVDEDFNDYIDDVIDNVIEYIEVEEDDVSDSEDVADENVDDFDWLDSPDGNDNNAIEWKYTSAIQKNGNTPKIKDVREINIDTNKTIYTDFYGLGGSLFPEILSNDGVSGYYSSVAWEFERQKTINASPNISRILIDMDAIITNTESNPSRLDYQNNKDYINYMQGVYDFSNDSANSFWEIMKCLNDSGTEIIFNTGWKCSERIKTWYPDVANDWRDSAPYDINAFVRANIAWLLEAQSRGIKASYLTFGNEVHWGGDFKTHYDSITYHTILICTMVEAMEYAKNNSVTYKYIDNNGDIKTADASKLTMDIKMVLSDTANNDGSWNTKLRENVKKVLGSKTPTVNSYHQYYNKIKTSDTTDRIYYGVYANAYDILCKWREEQGDTFLTEFYASSSGRDQDYYDLNTEHTGIKPGDWETSYASYFIAVANSGTKGLNAWELGTSYYPCTGVMKTSKFVDGAGSLFGEGQSPSDYRVASNYRLFSLLTNYIPAHSDVLMSKWEGDDMRVASFKLADGNYTFVVEANKSNSARTLKLNLDKALGKKLYRYHFYDSDTENRTLQGILIQPDKEFQSTAIIEDTVDSEYGVYVYSTKPPIEQIKLDKAVEEIEKDKTITIKPELLNCGSLSNIKWEITAASKKIGTSLADKNLMENEATRGTISVSNNVCTYTPGANAQSGDSVAIRAMLLDDSGNETGIYSVTIIYIK